MNDNELMQIQLLEKINDSLIGCFVVIDKDLNILSVNESFCRSFSVKKADVVGFPVDSIVRSNEPWAEAVKSSLCYILKHELFKVFLYVAPVAGKKRAFFCRAAPIYSLEDKFLATEIQMAPFETIVRFTAFLSDVRMFGADERSVVESELKREIRFTTKQENYIYMLARGFSNPEIASSFSVTIKTVENMLYALRKKVNEKAGENLSTRDELKQWFLRNLYGLKPPEGMFGFGIIPVEYDWEMWEYVINS